MTPPNDHPNSPPAGPGTRPGCLGRLIGAVVLAVLAGIGAWLWDALIEAPWAYSLSSLVGQDKDGRGTLTGPWIGEFSSPSQRLHGVLDLQIERRQWGSAGRTRGFTGPPQPDFAGTARLCGLPTDPTSKGPRKLWGYAHRDGSLVHAVIYDGPEHGWDLGALNGSWNRDTGTLTLAGNLRSHGGPARGGNAADDRQPVTITLTRGISRDAFEQRCTARGLTLPP